MNSALVTVPCSRSIFSSFRNSHATFKRKSPPGIFKGANGRAANCLWTDHFSSSEPTVDQCEINP